MTRGKDVSMLFTDIVKNMATTDMEFKKLIYLYIINYAKSHPDLAILAINIFRKVNIEFFLKKFNLFYIL
jgi:AP-1 complex subunit beta-1